MSAPGRSPRRLHQLAGQLLATTLSLACHSNDHGLMPRPCPASALPLWFSFTPTPMYAHPPPAVAVLGLGLLAMSEELGGQMSHRALEHLLQYGEPAVRQASSVGLQDCAPQAQRPQLACTTVRLRLTSCSSGTEPAAGRVACDIAARLFEVASQELRCVGRLPSPSQLPSSRLPSCRRAVPLALALLNVSSPDMSVMDTLSRLSHDTGEPAVWKTEGRGGRTVEFCLRPL